MPRALGGVLAVVVSAVLFSLHHHLREDFDRGVFLFRTMAGVLLGFAVKVPLMPFHTWLPATYVEAPSPVTMSISKSSIAG